MHPEVLRSTIKSLKQGFDKQSWWSYVQDDVKTRLMWVIEHVDLAGISFRDAFVTGFSWEHTRRLLSGEKSEKDRTFRHAADAILGSAMSEEAYACGKQPCRSVLNIDDWTDPNYADVQSCVFLCHQVDVLEQMGVIAQEDKSVPSPAKTIQLIKRMTQIDGQLRRNKPGKDVNTIYWDFDTETKGE